MNPSPRVHTPAFEAQVALAAVKGDRTLSQIATRYEAHIELVQAWKKQMLEQAAGVFASSVKTPSLKEAEAEQAELYEQIGRLKMEPEWLKKSGRLPVSGSGVRSRATIPTSACDGKASGSA